MGYKAEGKKRIETRERLALRNKLKEDGHLEIYGGSREIGMKSYLHDPMDYAKTLKLRSCGGPGPARKKRYTRNRGGEEEDTQRCPCGKAVESRTHIVGECEIYKEERDVSEEEMRK